MPYADWLFLGRMTISTDLFLHRRYISWKCSSKRLLFHRQQPKRGYAFLAVVEIWDEGKFLVANLTVILQLKDWMDRAKFFAFNKFEPVEIIKFEQNNFFAM